MTAFRSGLFAAALLGTSALVAPSAALAETPAPKFTTIDQNNVDLSTGLVWYGMEEGGIGSGPGRISMQRIWAEDAGWVDNWSGGLYPVTSGGVTKMYVQFGGISDTFSGSGTAWTSDKSDGSTLILNASNHYIYTTRDGTAYEFTSEIKNNATPNCPGANPASCQVPLSITQPNGLKFTLGWETFIECTNGVPPIDPDCELPLVKYKRLSSVASSAGYSLAISYASTDPHSADWLKRTGIAFSNSADPPSPTPSITYTYGTNTVDVTDPGGRTWRFTTDTSGRLTGIRRPGNTSNNVSYVYGAGGTITSATTDGVADAYSFSTSTGTMTVTDPASNHVTVVTDLTKGRPTSYQNELGKTWSYQYDSNARLTRLTAPEGNYTSYGYDARGNVTTVTNVAKSGSGLSNIVASASFDASCSNIVKCNKPNTTTDALGNVTNYTYDAAHGGVTKITQPAPATGAVRPETRYTYSQVTSAGGTLVWMPTKVAACQTLASCTNAADETQVTAAYNSNLLPTSTTRRNGTGTVTATSTMSYDPRGNMLTVDGPLSGTADTTAFKYDAADQTIGAISPDPDGAGALKNRAIRITYLADGQVSKQEIGTTLGQTDADFANIVVSQTVSSFFDSNSRVYMTRLIGGTTRQAQTQFSYDSLGRLDCTAVRMDLAQFIADASLSACTLGANTDPRDRITQNVYDAASQLTQVKVAVGTTDAATERTLSYTSNGMLATLKDGENNLTTFEYDGFDRLSKTLFPSATKGSGTSSVTDYELLTYDANSNVLSRRQRDANTINFTYDDLDRLTWKKANNEAANTFEYDNLGRMISAVKATNTQTFTYDALSRNLTQTGPQFTVTSEYDAAGRRTKVTLPGTGLHLNYDYLLTGEVTKVRENGATSGIGVLASYGYDDLGNRTSATYGNGASQAFGYDSVSRLSSLTVNLSGTANDLTKTFTYNPASQIVSETRSNDAYSQVLANGTQTTVTDGLNRLATVNGTAAAYDGRGNMILDPATGKTYSYLPSNNQLYNIPTPFATFGYDALDRLADVNNGGTVTNYVTDGTEVVAEYNSSNVLQKRYAFDGSGQPLVQYDAAGNRSWMLADERGSIVALANDSAAMTAIDTYDEYGIPAASNQGTFQYAGMMWLVRPGVYAPTYRAYGAHVGRFSQTDPIGLAGGVNLYTYVFNNPVNLIDPLGLLIACVTGPGQVGGTVVPGSTVTSCSEFWSLGSLSGGVGIGGGGGSDDPGGRRRPDKDRKPTDPCRVFDSNDTTLQNFEDERKFFDSVAALSDLIFVGAATTAVFFPPAASVAVLAKGFSLGATAVSAGFAVGESLHTGDLRYAEGAAVQAFAGGIAGRIGTGVAFGVLGRSQLRFAGRFGPNAFRAYRAPLERASTSLGSATAGIATCH